MPETDTPTTPEISQEAARAMLAALRRSEELLRDLRFRAIDMSDHVAAAVIGARAEEARAAIAQAEGRA